MPSLRQLLVPKIHLEIESGEMPVNCVNGYLVQNSSLCICYPGWTSDYNILEQCTVDSGLNNTNNESKEGIIYYDNDSKDEGTSIAFVIFLIFLILLTLGAVCALFMCLFKKYKDIKLLKEKIKFEKKRNKKLSLNGKSDINKIEGNKVKDINCQENNKDLEKDTEKLDVLNESDLYSYRDTEVKV